MRTVALLTDFGIRDTYTGAMKGVMLGIQPELCIVDLCHNVDRGNILSASYLLYSAFDHFPLGTVFLVVVDPSVGTEKNACICYIDGKVVICPDNGTISMLARMKGNFGGSAIRMEGLLKLKEETRISATFHGRDIYAPAAAWFCLGKDEEIMGDPITPKLLPDVLSERVEDGTQVSAKVLHIDHFGNVITGINRWEAGRISADNCSISVKDKNLTGVKNTFADEKEGSPLAYWGSSDFLELAINGGNLASEWGLIPGDEVLLKS